MGNKTNCVFMKELALTIGDIAQWYEKRQPVLIDAQPGSGKTFSVSNVMDKFAQSQNIKILAVAPRTTTVISMSEEYDNCKCVTVSTTQALQKNMNFDEEKFCEYINSFQILVIDEVHSMVTDVFIKENHPFMETIMQKFQGLVIGMTGTNFYDLEEIFTEVYGNEWIKVEVAKTYDFLYGNKLFFYKNEEDAKFIIKQALESGKKVFVGCDHIETLQEIGSCCKAQCFSIISKGNNKQDVVGKLKDAATKEFIKTGEYPTGRSVLLCTRANELGTNISDTVDVILVNSDDLSSLVQFSRRVRTRDGKQVLIFVRAYNSVELQEKYKDAYRHLQMCRHYEKNQQEFLERHHRYIDDEGGILYTAYNKETKQCEVRINPLRKAYWTKRVHVFVLPEMRYWVQQVCRVFGGCGFTILSKPELKWFMEKHENQFLAKEQQKKLKDISGKRTIKKINAVCEEEHIPQRIVSERGNEKKGGTRSQPRRWAIRRGG